MENSNEELRFQVSSDNSEVFYVGKEDDFMLSYATDGAFTTSVSIDIAIKQDNDKKYTNIGTLHGIYFKVGKAIDKDASLFDIFDSIDQDVYMVYEALVDDDGYFNFEYCGMKHNVFYIERFYIEESYRNCGYGKKTLDYLDDILNYSLNCEVGCYILIPNAIEKSDSHGFKILNDNNAKENLLRFYEKCGFRNIPKTEFMYINTD